MTSSDQNRAGKKYRAVLFDLDGTLLYTLEDLADSVNAALQAMGFPEQPLAHYNTAVGDGAEMMVKRSLPPDRKRGETLARALEITVAEYGRRWNAKTRPYDGVPAMLDGLNAAGVVKCILSNKPDPATRQVVAELLPDWEFDIVRGAREELPIKPDPRAALEIAGQCEIPPSEWLYVGDTDTDMQTAANAGMFALGVSWGFRTVAELEANGANAIANRAAEILDWISE